MDAYTWLKAEGETMPHNAVLAGQEQNGNKIYAARVQDKEELLPAKAVPALGGAFYPNAGVEHSTFDFEVLVGPCVSWKLTAGGDVPINAIPVGHTASGEVLYMGRTLVEGNLTPGKVHPSHGKLYVAYGGNELAFDGYEIMIV